MDDNAVWGLLFFTAIVTSILWRIRAQKRQRIFITDYQRGLRFVDGAFVDTVGPGSYPANVSNRQITVVDMRPRLIIVERVLYQDALLSPSVISIGAQLSVADAYTASTRLKDPTNDSATIVRDATRSVVSKRITSHSAESRLATAEEIRKTAEADLSKCGMTISNVEITETWSRPVQPRMVSGAN